jgi:hypothetical protein
MSETLYVAGPMSGYPEYNYPKFREVAKHLRDRGYTVLNPVNAAVPEGSPWETYMRAALAMVLAASGVATLPDWQESRGAAIEVGLAHDLGVPVRPWNNWLGRWAA